MELKPAHAYFRFYAELNDHLPPDRQYKAQERLFFVPSTVKDMIESFGIPHTEIELITVNGESADFSRVVRDGDRIAVYPIFESFDITSELRVRSQPLRHPSFVLDVHLGKLAAYLRMLGFDTLYRSCYSDPELVRISSLEHRTLLTRDRGVLKHSAISHGYWLRETDSRQQAAEVVRRFDLAHSIRPFTRCMACNGVIESVSRESIREQILPHTAELYDDFRQCSQCGRVYWKGTHYKRMRRWIEELTSSTRP
ncbi:MAG: Mut7-C RNAse domain-containing protein [Bryobacteraceae bacterium]